MRDRPLLICDLDETLIDGNSFRLLVSELARPRTWWSLGPSLPLRLAGLVAMRAARRLDRVSFKRATHALVRALPSGRRALLTRRMSLVLQQHLRRDVQAAVSTASKAGFVTLLATAAFEEHVRRLARTCGFDHVTATTWPSGPRSWVELSGGAKRDAVARAAADLQAGRPWILICDHEDDEPLADLCDEVFWVKRRSPLRPGATNEIAFALGSFADRMKHLLSIPR
jgi:phosphoserine phosphatase